MKSQFRLKKRKKKRNYQSFNTSFPIWALYYKKLIANESLNVSKKEFEALESVSIRINWFNEPVMGEDTFNEKAIIEGKPGF